jgi:hypothetical protein
LEGFEEMRLRDLMRRRAFRAFKCGCNSFSDETERVIRHDGYRWLLEGNMLIGKFWENEAEGFDAP